MVQWYYFSTKVRGQPGQLEITAGRHDTLARSPGRYDGASCSPRQHDDDGSAVGRCESAFGAVFRGVGRGAWALEVRGQPGRLGTTAGRLNAAARNPGRHGGHPCSVVERGGNGGVAGRRESAAEATEEGPGRPRSRGGRVSLGRPQGGAARRRATAGVTAAVPVRRQGATATAASRDAGRARPGQQERGLGARGPGTAGSARDARTTARRGGAHPRPSWRHSLLVGKARQQRRRRGTSRESAADAPTVRSGRMDSWGQLGGPTWPRDG